MSEKKKVNFVTLMIEASIREHPNHGDIGDIICPMCRGRKHDESADDKQTE